MSAAWVVLLLLGQGDGGLSPPPPPPEAPPESAYPRVIRTPGKVCVESLEASGAVKTDCRLEQEGSPTPRWRKAKEPASRVVADLGLLGGVIFPSTRLVPELAFTIDVGVRFPTGVGVVGLVHGHVTGVVNRYGLGAGVRFGDRSHALIGASTSLMVIGNSVAFSVTVLARFALVFGNHFALMLMPTFTMSGNGVVASLSAGVGLTY